MSTASAGTGGVPLDGPALLDRAVAYLRPCLRLVACADLASPTPCREWDLLTLLHHLDDSLAAFTEAAHTGAVALAPVREPAIGEVIADRLRVRAGALLGAWCRADRFGRIEVGGVPVCAGMVAGAGALEVTLHGWDVARACGLDRPLPRALALDLLGLVPVLVEGADRPARFARRVVLPDHASPGERLLAAVGRSAAPGTAPGAS